MKKPIKPVIYPNSYDYREIEIEYGETLGHFIQRVENEDLDATWNPDMGFCYLTSSFEKRKQAAEERYERELKKYEKWLESDEAKAAAEKQQATQIRNLENQLAKLKKNVDKK